ncbi:discoidin domain-containing protein, partial [Streptomyces sp. SID11233]|nr:discoidin domain-containing protein [Streptomyces sp. SID11233]
DAPGPNLALGRPATASGANGQYGAGNVTDGNQSSYWEGPGASFPQWVRVDLGATTSVDEVTLKLPTTWEARDETLTVQGSTDGSTWSTLSASA